VEDGRLVGIISADDIARFCADDELIGEMMRRITTYTAPPAAHGDDSFALAHHVEYMDG
jgi:CBS domain-containing protein